MYKERKERKYTKEQKWPGSLKKKPQGIYCKASSIITTHDGYTCRNVWKKS